MAIEIGDLWPQISGTASLGAEMTNGGFTGEIRPLAHIHMNSGIFHNPDRGSSGIIRLQNEAYYPINALLINNAEHDYFGFSFDGGLNWPLEIGLSPHTIEGISVDMISPFGGLRWVGSGTVALLSVENDIRIATVSGPGSGFIFISTIDNDNYIELDTVGDDADIKLETNGSSSAINLHTFGVASTISITSDQSSILLTALNGTYNVNAQTLSENISSTSSRTSQNENFTTDVDFTVQSVGGNISFEGLSSSPSAGNMSINMLGNCDIDVFNHSGILSYRFGPYESWHQASRGTAILYPIPHSGHINQMIQASRQNANAASSGLQRNYEFHRMIVPTSAFGDLQFISNTAKSEFSTFGTQAELNISGLFAPPTLANLETGDLYMMNHSVISGIVAAQTSAIVRAQALGIGTLAVQTGSGIINVSVGSGLAQFGNSTLMQITTVLQTVPLDTTLECGDQNYGLGAGANSGVITVFSPGLYKINYKITNDKTVGTTAQECTTRLELNDSGSAIFGSVINTIHINNGVASANTASTVLLINMDAGDNIRMKVNSSAAGAQNCNVIARGATLMIEKVGPKRGAAGSE